jgi:hypothetical protein
MMTSFYLYACVLSFFSNIKNREKEKEEKGYWGTF